MNSPVNCSSKPIPARTIERGAPTAEPRCSVKEAAFRIRKSTSTVYRMRRRSGPLRFITEGRRIHVELSSLEAFQSHQAPNQAARETKAVEANPSDGMGASTPALHQKNHDNDPRDQNEEHVKIPWLGSAYGKGRNKMRSTTLNTAVVAPMPSARVIRTLTAKSGLRRNPRSA